MERERVLVVKIWMCISCKKTLSIYIILNITRTSVSIKLHVPFAEYRLFHWALLQKRPVILRKICMRTRKDKIERACVGREDMDEHLMQKDRDEACVPEYVRAHTYLFY